ncbi:MAG: SDR family NAD(P)-dependent oxidoreductase, partial [Clostridia bacterium]|nr:SDR family NAD(P)-dependent oxidoreductase [Clostridia bacterium]
MKLFEGKIAVVTGAGGTLCSEIALQLALDGVLVFLVGRTKEKLQKTADAIQAAGGTEPVIFCCDVTDRNSVAALAQAVEARGGCDYLVNGAGGNDIKAMPTITKFDERELTGTLPEGQKGLYNVDMEA